MILFFFLVCIILITTFIHLPFLVFIQLYIGIFSIVLSAAYLSLTERVFLALIHKRTGPAVTGAPIGILQPLVDGLKVLLKEPCLPSKSRNLIFLLGPFYTFTLAILIFTLIPIDIYTFTFIDFKLTVFAFISLLSISGHGILFSSYFSNSKIAFISAIRSTLLAMSYGLSTFLVLLGTCFICGTFNFRDIIFKQGSSNSLFLALLPFAVLYIITMLTEIKKIPFDVAESEAELGSGYMVEYSGINFALLVLSEYIFIIIAVLIFIILFTKVSSLVNFMLKILFLLFGYLIVRSVLPNLRFDQIMELH
jgi:NADH-quinone oxidoreductase subunit H